MTTMISLYDSAGRVLSVKSVEDATFATESRPGAVGHVAGVVDAATQYVVSGAATDRPANPTTISGSILSNVPVPATVVVDGTPYATNDATVELDLPLPGVYMVLVQAFPKLDKMFTVTVV